MASNKINILKPTQKSAGNTPDAPAATTARSLPAVPVYQKTEDPNKYSLQDDKRLEKNSVDPVQLTSTNVEDLPLKTDGAPLKPYQPIQKKDNKTGLPDNLKLGIEGLSGYSMDDVKVNYNSEKPAQLNALAYAQGTDIHISPGQEKHLPHEAWHVVQQKQGKVQPTLQMKGTAVNDDKELETEADIMGEKAIQQRKETGAGLATEGNKDMGNKNPISSFPLQMKLGTFTSAAHVAGSITAYRTASEYIKNINVANFIDNIVIPDPINWEAHKMSNPTVRVPATQKSGKIFILKDYDSLAKWITRLYIELNVPGDSLTGFAIDHSALVATKTAHAANWNDFIVNHLDQIQLNSTVKKLANPYKKAFVAAKKAAARLDAADPGLDIAPMLSDINDLALIIRHNTLNAAQPQPSIPTWQTESHYGSGVRVHARYFPGYTMAKGSGDSIKTPLDWFYSGRTQDGIGAYYVKGHLLNDHVGGLAKNYNLSPLKTNRNKQHEAAMEHDLKESVRLMTLEWQQKQPSTYRQIDYTVELGPQTGPRDLTRAWRIALDYWNLQKTTLNYAHRSLNDILVDPTVPEIIKNIIRTWRLDYVTTLMPQVYSWVHTSALLLETEDYLVRDWLVHLKLTSADGSVEDQFTELKNEKLNDPKVLIKDPLDTRVIKGADVIVTDKDRSPNRPTHVKKLIADSVGLPHYDEFLKFVTTTEYALLDITNHDQIEAHTHIVLSLITRFEEYKKNQLLSEKRNAIIQLIIGEQDNDIILELYKRTGSIIGDLSLTHPALIKLKIIDVSKNTPDESLLNKIINEMDRSRKLIELKRTQQAQQSFFSIVPFGAPQEQRFDQPGAVVPFYSPQGQGFPSSGFSQSFTNFAFAPTLTPEEYVLQSFQDLSQYREGKHVLNLAVSMLQRTPPEHKEAVKGAWLLLLGKLDAAVKSANRELAEQQLIQAEAWFNDGPNVDVENQLGQDIQEVVQLAAIYYKTDPMQILKAMHNAEPNIRLDMLARLRYIQENKGLIVREIKDRQ